MRQTGDWRLALWAWWHRHVVLPRAPQRLAAQRRFVVQLCPPMAEVFRELDERCGPWSPTELSYAERRKRGALEDPSLTYGEVEWRSFVELVARAKPRREDRFVELGCGSGQFSLFMHLHHGMDVLGLELIHALVVIARSLPGARHGAGVEFREQDFLEADLSAGTLFYATTTCLPPSHRERLAQRLEVTAPGTRVICVGRPLSSNALELRERVTCRASWGREDAWIYQRASAAEAVRAAGGSQG